MPDIQQSILIRSDLARVWRAITDSSEFGRWFGAAFDGPFTEGQTATGHIVPTTVDQEIAATQEPYRGMPLTAHVIAIEPMRRFAFRWHPVPDSAVLTTVAFTLDQEPGGVRVTITEDGFDSLPPDHRAAAREGNDGGWDAQTRLLAGYLEHAS
jgi:uncharacterized protein YndB with AHSA1/START domain